MKQRGRLIIVSGFSGSGKGTITRELVRRYPDRYALSVSATTRKPREGEEDGVHYFFLSKEEFEEWIREGKFLEHACYVGNYYGTPAAYVEEKLDEGENVILEIEIQGAMQVKKKMPDSLLVFITPPSAEILEERLRGRGTESEESIRARLAQAVKEAEGCEAYDYLVVNDDLEDSIRRLHEIVLCESCRMSRNLLLIGGIRSDLKKKVEVELN